MTQPIQRLAPGVIKCAAFVLGQAAVGGRQEAQGPLGPKFAETFGRAELGEDCWEMAETHLQQAAMRHALRAANRRAADLHFGGDLLNQCSATNFTMREMQFPVAGLYSACATFAESLALAALAAASGAAECVSACVSSHFCAAEKQFRFPLEYGGQPTPASQRTATAAGAVILGPEGSSGHAKITHAIFGRVVDMGIKDANEMGAAMAPAALDTLKRFLDATHTMPGDYDMILTGDLGAVGSALLLKLARRELGLELSGVHRDCGMLLYHAGEQDVGVGGSGAGCSAAVVCAEILPALQSGSLRAVLLLGTGALLSAISPLQGETIPAICHGVRLTRA
ncbi:MAG: stage V sporulation protein AD [Oscillospiraceae bacterium]|nr:stage V sporulation protein AD [Oscillospiraceae bacterium]